MSATGWFIVAFAIAYIAYQCYRAIQGKHEQRDQYDAAERRYMPREIAEGRLVLSEKLLRARHPDLFVARCDQVYLTRDGYLVPCETKTRKRVQIADYDVIELSVQALVLRNSRSAEVPKAKVADWGYVRVLRGNNQPRYLRTKLLTEAQIMNLRHRRAGILKGDIAPHGARSSRMCDRCAYALECPARTSTQ